MADVETSRIEVPTSIEDATTYLRNTATQLQGELDALAGKLNPLHEQWTGSAGQQYTDAQQMWSSDATALFSPDDGLLGEIADAMRSVSDNYDTTEQYNKRAWTMS